MAISTARGVSDAMPLDSRAIRLDCSQTVHDDVIKWKHFPHYWPFVWGTHRSPVNSPHKGQWRGALMFSLICVWINGWVNSHEAGDLRRYHAHYDVIVMNTARGASDPMPLDSRTIRFDCSPTIQNVTPGSIRIYANSHRNIWQGSCGHVIKAKTDRNAGSV